MKLPNIKFSNWFRWDERIKIQNSEQPGVYMLAHTPDLSGARARCCHANRPT